jgi:archaellum biogenesis protein FlaJ (TadC family)
MEEIIYKIIFVFFLILMIFIRMPHSTIYKKTEIYLSKKEKREKLLVALNGISMMLVPLIYVFTGWLDFFKMNLPDWIRISGIVIIFHVSSVKTTIPP